MVPGLSVQSKQANNRRQQGVHPVDNQQWMVKFVHGLRAAGALHELESRGGHHH